MILWDLCTQRCIFKHVINNSSGVPCSPVVRNMFTFGCVIGLRTILTSTETCHTTLRLHIQGLTFISGGGGDGGGSEAIDRS